MVERLRGEYEKWWELVSEKFDEDCPIVLGSDAEPESILTSHDWHGEECAWNQGQIRGGTECNGYWIVEVAKAGEYAFELRRWPVQEDRAIVEGIPGDVIDMYHGGKAMPFDRARIQVGSITEECAVGESEKTARFTFRLQPGVDARADVADQRGLGSIGGGVLRACDAGGVRPRDPWVPHLSEDTDCSCRGLAARSWSIFRELRRADMSVLACRSMNCSPS